MNSDDACGELTPTLTRTPDAGPTPTPISAPVGVDDPRSEGPLAEGPVESAESSQSGSHAVARDQMTSVYLSLILERKVMNDVLFDDKGKLAFSIKGKHDA